MDRQKDKTNLRLRLHGAAWGPRAFGDVGGCGGAGGIKHGHPSGCNQYWCLRGAVGINRHGPEHCVVHRNVAQVSTRMGIYFSPLSQLSRR